jgi:hypothetical protein
MRDWQKLVRQRLATLPLDPADGEEVRAELAAHLEESYEALRAEGLSERRAMRKALHQAGDWRALQHRIVMAKSGGQPMRTRLHQLWIPGFLTFALSTILLIVLQQYSLQPHLVSRSGTNLPWLLFLPCLGALGAYLSSRAGGSRQTVLLASVFPVLGLAAAFLLMFPIGLILERVFGWRVDFRMVATALLMAPIGSLLLPGTALLVGGLLTQFVLSRRAAPAEKAIS